MKKNLVIVESPAKAQTIEKFLGKDFVVESSYGHVRDLVKKGMGIDIEKNFLPTYTLLPDKVKQIQHLKKAVAQSAVVYLATDDDREGEAISWHLCEALEIKKERARRIVFREITKSAIQQAIQHPRGLDMDLVDAQQARRILDRLVGFEISPILWQKIKAGLSAGRVQSVAVRLIVEQEKSIQKFSATSAFALSARLAKDKDSVLAKSAKKYKDKADALAFLTRCIGATYRVQSLEKKPFKRSPSAPFTTSTLQQEASVRLSFSVQQTMVLAQKLYEAGKISYMRTDSTRLSEEAIATATQVIHNRYGASYVQTRQYKTKSQSAQEAHEAIRPTDFSVSSTGANVREQKLYALIWRRALASQMADARLSRSILTIAIDTPTKSPEEPLVATGETIDFKGFLELYLDHDKEKPADDKEDSEDNPKESAKEQRIPAWAVGTTLQLHAMHATERFSRPPPRFTEATLVKKLEEMGIGRPSTYAPTISTIQQRNYVKKESRPGKEREYNVLILENDSIQQTLKKETTGAEKFKLFPSDIGVLVNDFLLERFADIMDYSFTADIETQLDKIANGGYLWQDMIQHFYTHFHPQVEATKGDDTATVNRSRELGTDPQTGEPVYAKIGRYGPYVQIGDMTDDKKPRSASLQAEQRMQSISLEDALELFKLPREVGSFEDDLIVAAIGRYGPYLRHKDAFYSLKEPHNPLEIALKDAQDIIQTQREEKAKSIIQTFEQDKDLQVLRGRYGPYIKHAGKNYKIPKNTSPEALSFEACMELVHAKGAPAAAKKAPRKKKKA